MTTIRRGMPEATVLYSVTAVVIAALFLWVAVVLKTAKEPWGRPAPIRAAFAPDVELEPALAVDAGAPRVDADETAKAASGEARTSGTPPAADEAKADVPAAKA